MPDAFVPGPAVNTVAFVIFHNAQRPGHLLSISADRRGANTPVSSFGPTECRVAALECHRAPNSLSTSRPGPASFWCLSVGPRVSAGAADISVFVHHNETATDRLLCETADPRRRTASTTVRRLAVERNGRMYDRMRASRDYTEAAAAADDER